MKRDGLSAISSLILRAWNEDGSIRLTAQEVHSDGPPDAAPRSYLSIEQVQQMVGDWLDTLPR